jgi:hypothetical protein
MAKDLSITAPHPLTPYPFGILSVASVSEYTEAQDHWSRYAAHEFDSDGFALRLLTIDDTDVTDGNLYEGTSAARFKEYVPFGIEVEDFSSAFSLPAQDRFARVTKIMEAATQKAVERELWTGVAAIESSNSNSYLVKNGEATNVTVASGGDNPRVALARLEGALSESPAGLRGVIHMSRRMASLCFDFLERVDFSARLDNDDVNKKDQILVTKLGTPVVVGTGYTGVGPTGATGAAVTNTTEWMFATGYVDVHLGAIKVVNEDLARGFAPNTNDMRIKAVRAAAVHFEPDCHYAVRVDFSATV